MDRVGQGSNDIVVDAPPEAVWRVLEDGDRLTDWAFMVRTTTGGREDVGAVRRCQVEFGGKRGNVSERCVEMDPNRRIAWEMVDDSLGFSRMFAEMGFAFTLTPASGARTIVRNESFYRPRTLVARVVNALIMRRKFAAMRRRLLANLKTLAEQDAGGQSKDPGSRSRRNS